MRLTRTVPILLLMMIALVGAVDRTEAGSARLLVVNKSDNTLSIVDPESLEVVAKVATGFAPHEVTVSRDGTTAWVSNYGDRENPGNSISVVDVAGAKELRRVDVGLLRPHGIVESEGKIWFTAEGSRAVARLNPETDEVEWKAETGQEITHMVVVVPERGKAYTANIGSHTVTIVRVADRLVRHIETGKGPEGIDLSPDRRELWVGNREDGTVSIIDTGTDEVTATFAVGNFPIRVKFTPDGTRALVSDAAANELIVIDTTTHDVIRRIPTGDMPVGILVEPNGRRAWVAATQADKVVRIDLDKLEVIGTISPGRTPDGMAWASPPPPAER